MTESAKMQEAARAIAHKEPLFNFADKVRPAHTAVLAKTLGTDRQAFGRTQLA